MAALQITDDMIRRFGEVLDPDEDPFDYPDEVEEVIPALAAVASLILAIELRRLADELNGLHTQPEMNAGLGLAIRKMRARADELDAAAPDALHGRSPS